MAMTLVSTVTVGSGGALSIAWSNIPQTGKDLMVVMSARNNLSSGYRFWNYVNFNTGGIYAYTILTTQAGTVSSQNQSLVGVTNSGWLGHTPSDGATANTFGSMQLYIPNYANSVPKTYTTEMVTENNSTSSDIHLIAGSWNQTAAISAIDLRVWGSQLFVQNSTASLYIIS
jgi:hypothetical protein